MKLVKVDDVRGRGRLADIDEINDALSLSIDAATLHLEALIRTKFTQATYTDKYWIDSEERPFTDQFITLYLKNGYVDSGSSVTVRVSSTLEDLATADPIDAAYLHIDYEKGLVMITGTDAIRTMWSTPNRMFCQITYTAGFTSSNTAYGAVATAAEVPDWLKEAATLTAVGFFNGDDNCTAEDAKSKGGGLNIFQLSQGHIRFEPSAIKPLI